MDGRPDGLRRKTALAVPIAWAVAQLYDAAVAGARFWLATSGLAKREGVHVLLERDVAWVWKEGD